jgi:restriction enzyme bgcI subunit beta
MSKLTLDSVEWGEFRIKDLFELHLSKGDNQANLLDEGNIPLVSSGLNINGISKFIREGDGKSELFDGNILTVDMFGKAFYHEYNFFSVSHGRINILIPKFEITKFIAVFIVAEIDKNFSNVFSYNRMCSQKRLRSSKILLPIDYKGKPNWQFMEDYVKQEMKVQSSKVAAYYENKLMKLSFELLDLEVEWKEFKVKDIFEFKKKSSKGLNYLEKNDKGISYLGATNRNNGVLEFVKDDEKLKYKGNCIAFIRNGEGSMGYAVYKKEDFIATQDISVGYNDNLNLYTGTFITTIADRVRGKYNFGYKRNQNRLENEILHLPIDKNGEPHWEYMSQFMKKLEKENIEKTLNHIYIYIIVKKLENNYLLENVSWKEFFIEDICEIKSGKDIYERERIEGRTPYITATANNNGIGYFISNKNATLQEKCISVNRNGSVGYSFYHSYSALFGNDTRKLIPKYRDDHVAKFISFMISSQKEKYGYGYKMGTARLKRQKILLPVNEEEVIDYDFMKKYIILQEIKSIEQVIHKYSEN